MAEGAAIGLAFTVLYEGIKTLVVKSVQFKPLLEELIVTLDFLQPYIKEEAGVRNGERDHSYFENQMKKGRRLIDKLSNVSSWTLLKPYYTDQLVKLDASLGKMVLHLLLVRNANDNEIIQSKILRNVKLHDQAQTQNVDSGRSQTGTAAPKPPFSPIGLDVPLRELKMMLLEDGGVSMLSVTAPGGSGKSTLVQMFCHDQEVKDMFNDRIFFATVSNKPDLDGLKTSLQQFLHRAEENAALLVLDDVWPDTSGTLLEEFYQLSEGSSYRTLVTSRSTPNYGSHYPLGALTAAQAMDLLRISASVDQSSHALDELQKQIVEYCKMSPLAITVVGKSLVGGSIEIWHEKVSELSRSTILERDDALAVLRTSLQSSLDVLGEDGAMIKECFIDLASLPEHRRIPAGVLVDMWAELHELHEDALSIAKLQHLNNRSLANLVINGKESNNVHSCYSEQFVSQHAMLRELAMHQIREDPNGESKRLNIDICGDVLPKRWTRKDKLKKTLLLSISTDGEFSSKWGNMSLPKAKVLLLNFQTNNYTFPNFNKNLSKALKVLIVRNNGLAPAELSNFEQMFSLPELKRVRLERISSLSVAKKKELKGQEKIYSFIFNIGQASSTSSIQISENLEKLSLFMCNINHASGIPGNTSIRFFEAFPNLMEINIDYCNDLGELPADIYLLKHLKKLIITYCHKLSALPEGIGKLVKLEVLRLRSCTMLELLESSIKNLKNLTFLDISDCFGIKELPEDIGEMRGLKKIDMRQCSRLQVLPASILDLESTLKEVICDEGTVELWEPFPNIKNMHFKVVKKELNQYGFTVSDLDFASY